MSIYFQHKNSTVSSHLINRGVNDIFGVPIFSQPLEILPLVNNQVLLQNQYNLPTVQGKKI